MEKLALIRVYGIVQGVGMRYSVFSKAVELGLRGYVKNLSDGSVEIEAEGNELAIQELIDYIKNELRWARVDDIHVLWQNPSGKFDKFEIKYR